MSSAVVCDTCFKFTFYSCKINLILWSQKLFCTSPSHPWNNQCSSCLLPWSFQVCVSQGRVAKKLDTLADRGCSLSPSKKWESQRASKVMCFKMQWQYFWNTSFVHKGVLQSTQLSYGFQILYFCDWRWIKHANKKQYKN